jgi:capsular exopolysaccharide synthesis family protein
MGRITDALRRTDTLLVPEPPVAAGVFVSPWPSDGAPDERRAPVDVSADHTSPIDAMDAEWRERLSVGRLADPALAHQFGRLAATLIQVQRAQRIKSVLIASAAPGDGKTLTALNLALVLSESYGRRVLLIEGDLRRPALSKAARLPMTGGLSELLRVDEDWHVPLVRLTDALMLLPAGRPDPDPLNGLTSPRMLRLLQDAAGQFDWVVIDTPPLGATADAGLLAPLVDAAILVIRAGVTAHAAVQSAIDTLGRDRIAGIVLNAASPEETAGYELDYSHYSDASEKR